MAIAAGTKAAVSEEGISTSAGIANFTMVHNVNAQSSKYPMLISFTHVFISQPVGFKKAHV
jgi:hypothetical protein